MRNRSRLLTVAAGLAASLAVLGVCSLIYARGRSYDIRPEITLPEYRTDAARAIDAYERTMNRYMTLTERSLAGVNADMREVLRKLDSIDRTLTDLSTRIARIEGALGIEEPVKPVEGTQASGMSEQPAVPEGGGPTRR